tara:strand:- start:1528 stop:1839 length:312 start_codon:yes stop_codon:yes gene_type:complete
MENYVWKKGESPIRSQKKNIKSNIIDDPEKLALVETNKEINFRAEVNFEKQIENHSERENLNGKLNDRYLIQQINQNPFLKNNSYIDDLKIQEEFLRPKSSYE